MPHSKNRRLLWRLKLLVTTNRFRDFFAMCKGIHFDFNNQTEIDGITKEDRIYVLKLTTDAEMARSSIADIYSGLRHCELLLLLVKGSPRAEVYSMFAEERLSVFYHQLATANFLRGDDPLPFMEKSIRHWGALLQAGEKGSSGRYGSHNSLPLRLRYKGSIQKFINTSNQGQDIVIINELGRDNPKDIARFCFDIEISKILPDLKIIELIVDIFEKYLESDGIDVNDRILDFGFIMRRSVPSFIQLNSSNDAIILDKYLHTCLENGMLNEIRELLYIFIRMNETKIFGIKKRHCC